MAGFKKSYDEVKEGGAGVGRGNPMPSVEKAGNTGLRIDDVDKPAAAIDPAVTPTTPATAEIEAPATSETDAPATSIPEKFTEADTHAAPSQPLAIVQEAHVQPAPQDTQPAAPEVFKDAKAS